MRHNKKFNHLGRKCAHRQAMLSNMASSLILHKRITTTTARAKALKIYVEPLITKSKDDSTHARRIVFSYLQNKEAVSELFREISVKVADRPGGYTRILHTGFRLGDAAEMCIIELVDFNETYAAGAAGEAKGRTRRGRSGGAKKAAPAPAAVQTGEETAGETADAAPAAEKAPEKKAPAKKAPAKAAPAKKPAPKSAPAPKVSGAKTKAVKTAASKKS